MTQAHLDATRQWGKLRSTRTYKWGATERPNTQPSPSLQVGPQLVRQRHAASCLVTMESNGIAFWLTTLWGSHQIQRKMKVPLNNSVLFCPLFVAKVKAPQKGTGRKRLPNATPACFVRFGLSLLRAPERGPIRAYCAAPATVIRGKYSPQFLSN